VVLIKKQQNVSAAFLFLVFKQAKLQLLIPLFVFLWSPENERKGNSNNPIDRIFE